ISKMAPTNRVLMFAPESAVMRWIRDELDDERLLLLVAPGVREVVTMLVDQPPPRPQILVADFASLGPADVLHLHSVRDRGWFGSVIALGAVSAELKSSLNIGRVLERPLVDGALRK